MPSLLAVGGQFKEALDHCRCENDDRYAVTETLDASNQWLQLACTQMELVSRRAKRLRVAVLGMQWIVAAAPIPPGFNEQIVLPKATGD
ncbi:MAG TPA: hypothetical protein VFZ97_10555 [Acidimicrobiales bacterium]